jgi:hypothetical protein
MNMFKHAIIAVGFAVSATTAFADTVVVTKTSEGTPASYTSKSGNFSAYGQATTTYTQPSTVGGNVTQGTQSGSSSNTSYGVGITYRFK